MMTMSSFEDNTVAGKGEQVVQVLVQSLQLPQTNFGMASLSLLLTQSPPVSVALVTEQVKIFLKTSE